MTESERWDRTAAAIDKYRVTPQLIEIIALARPLYLALSWFRKRSRRFRGWAIKSRQDAIALGDLVHRDKQMAFPPEGERERVGTFRCYVSA